MIKQSERLLIKLEDLLLFCSCVCVVAIVAVTGADVVARGYFNAPFAWSHDLITQYLLVAMFFLSLPYVSRISGHMTLDYFARKITVPRLRAPMVLVGEVLALILVVGIIYGASGIALEAYRAGDRLPGVLGWPTWPSRAVCPLGLSVLTLRLLMRIIETLRAMRQNALPSFLTHGGH